jgi:Aspartyl protease
MTKYPFNLQTDEDVIIVTTKIDGYKIHLALDTAATQTVIDFNILLMLGYNTANKGSTVLLETANGVIEAHHFVVKSFETIGVQRSNLSILTYDFLEKGIFSPYDGVLGLDFFRFQGILTIDFLRQDVWFNENEV